MQINSAEYFVSSPNLESCPKTELPEFAFIGRSNVGKSSLINMLVAKKGMALVSGKPGKTRIINHFVINDEWYLVDLPGYGYAHVSQLQRGEWIKHTEEYLAKRPNLFNVFLLIDCRIEPQKKDLDFANWLGKYNIPFSIVFTKADKPRTTELQSNIATFKRAMKKDWAQLPPMFVTSATDKRGREEILSYIDQIIKDIKPKKAAK
ncbi:MAG: ribosome biogenesis GTP-binding protein YihA/YsxC [Bacteroidia bacterium]